MHIASDINLHEKAKNTLFYNYFREKMDFSLSNGTFCEKTVKMVFEKIWSDKEAYGEDVAEQFKKQWISYSNGKIIPWVKQIFNEPGLKSILDVGCGLGVSAKILLEEYKNRVDYTGIDLINNTLANQYISRIGFKKALIKQASIIDYSLKESADVAICLGSLQLIEDKNQAIKNILFSLKPNGHCFGWVAGKTKPLRSATDSVLRNYYNSLETIDEKLAESSKHSQLSIQISEAIKDININVPENIPSLGIDAGRFGLQNLIYDYLLKIPYHKNESRSLHQVFNWYAIPEVHQFTKDSITALFKNNCIANYEIIETQSGIAFQFSI